MKLSWLDYIRMLFKGKAVVERALEEGKLMIDAHSRSSWKSGEFWVAVLSGLGAVAAQAAGIIPAPHGAVILAASGFFYALSRGMAKNADPLGGVKPSWGTTEFWMNVLPALGSMLGAVQGVVRPEIAAVLALISSIAISISRGLAKGGVQPGE